MEFSKRDEYFCPPSVYVLSVELSSKGSTAVDPNLEESLQVCLIIFDSQFQILINLRFVSSIYFANVELFYLHQTNLFPV